MEARDVGCLAVRLTPGQDLKDELLKLMKSTTHTSAWVQTCVGSCDKITIRLANADRHQKNEILHLDQRFEILSLVGTIDADGEAGHLHISLGDKDGRVWGGHLMSGCRIFTTAEIVLGTSRELSFGRKFDPETGFPELAVDRVRSAAAAPAADSRTVAVVVAAAAAAAVVAAAITTTRRF